MTTPEKRCSVWRSFFARGEALEVFLTLLGGLLLAGLNGKVGLRAGNGRLARIAVLGDEVAGVAGELVIGYFTFGAATRRNHFVGADKMVFWRYTRLFGRHYCPTDRLLKHTPSSVLKKRH